MRWVAHLVPPCPLAVAALVCAAAMPATAGGGDRQSAIVRNFDGTGTTVVKPLPDGSTFGLPGDYVTFVQIEGTTTSYAWRLLDVVRSPDGFPLFVAQTNPATLQAVAFRNADLPDGSPEQTNFNFGMQTDDHCIDLDVTPTVPGGPLAGT